MPAGKAQPVGHAHAQSDRRRALAREAQRLGQLEGQQLVGGRHQHVAAAVEPAQGELQVAQGAEPLLLAFGAVADHAGGQQRGGGCQVAPQGVVVAVVGHDQGRLDHARAGQVGEQVVDEEAHPPTSISALGVSGNSERMRVP